MVTSKKSVKKFIKKGKAKIVKNTKIPKELLNLEEADPLAVTAKFSISEIKMKNDWRWKVKMLVHAILPDTHHDYNIKLEFDDAPFLKTLQQLEADVVDLLKNPTLLPDVDRKSLRDLENRIAKTQEEMDKLAAACTDIEFVAQSEEIKYADGDTSLLFKILDSVIGPLNEQKYRLVEYRAIMTPIYKKLN